MNIIVPIDFSDVTERVLREASIAALARGAKIWLLHVAMPEPDFVGFEGGPDVVRDQVAKEFREEHRQVQGYADQLTSEGIDVTALLVQGPTVQTILEEADRHDADLIVMGSHGHGTLYQMIVGSVSEGVLRKTRCPVLLVPADS